MTTITCCPLSTGGDFDGPAFRVTTTPRARKEHYCCECRGPIPVGAKYERTTGLWDGRMDTHKTCLLCVEIRNHFSCDGWIYGLLWEDLRDNFFPEMRAGGPCMEGLSPAAKQRLFDERTAWAMNRSRS